MIKYLYIALCAIVFFACNDSVTPPPDTAQVSLTVKMNNRTMTSPVSLQKLYAALVDSIKLTRARLLINSIDFEGGDEDSDDDDLEFSTKPMVLKLSLVDSVQTVMVAAIPFGTYDEVEIEIRKLSQAYIDSLAPADSVLLADFIAKGVSVIVEGVVYSAGVAAPFIYSAAVRVEQEYELDPPLAISADNPIANITLMVYANFWFMRNGVLLDPNDAVNQNAIKWNIENSFEMYEDGDGDGDNDDDD